MRTYPDRLETTEALDRPVAALGRLADRLDDRTRRALRGEGLDHPLHPMLTDLPIGFFTSAMVLDLVGGRRARPAADGLIALGVVSALPTVVTGFADWTGLEQGGRRVGVVHAASNAAGVVLYTWSLVARVRRRHLQGVLVSLVGAGVMTIGGYLGGHLAFGSTPVGSVGGSG